VSPKKAAFVSWRCGGKDHLAEDAAASVHVDEVDLLDRFEAQVLAHDLACDQNDRGTVAVGFVEAIDEVETAWSARACAGGEAAGELSFGARRERSMRTTRRGGSMSTAMKLAAAEMLRRYKTTEVALVGGPH
jgi:hypothetical protein